MFSKLLLASVAAVGLLLAGPQKASAQTISACVNSATGLLYIVAANANCPPASGNVTWTKITLSTTPGVLAGRSFKGAADIAANGALFVFPSLSNVNFGTTIGTNGAAPWNSFLLQPGIYQIHFSGGTSLSGLQLNAIVNSGGQATWYNYARVKSLAATGSFRCRRPTASSL